MNVSVSYLCRFLTYDDSDFFIFRRVRILAEIAFVVSVRLLLCPHISTRLPLHVFS